MFYEHIEILQFLNEIHPQAVRLGTIRMATEIPVDRLKESLDELKGVGFVSEINAMWCITNDGIERLSYEL